ncbi:MAG: hypothetical protein ABI779_05765 [Acidobacteriota bacterium]
MRWNLLPREPYFFEAFVSMTRELQRGAALLSNVVLILFPLRDWPQGRDR